MSIAQAQLTLGAMLPKLSKRFADLHVHLVAATPNATWVELFPDSTILNFRRLLKSSLEVRDGELVLPEGPGLGIELDEEVVERYSVDGWQ